jgi:hypothetical protein
VDEEQDPEEADRLCEQLKSLQAEYEQRLARQEEVKAWAQKVRRRDQLRREEEARHRSELQKLGASFEQLHESCRRWQEAQRVRREARQQDTEQLPDSCIK